MTGFSIREFSYPADYAQVYALWEQCGPGVSVGRSDAPAEIERKLGYAPDLFLVAEAGGEIVGSVIGGYDGRRGLIYHLAVSRAQRRQGLGQALMAEIEARLRARGCLKCYLLLVAGNDEAARFYQSIGWGPMDVTVYAKELR